MGKYIEEEKQAVVTLGDLKEHEFFAFDGDLRNNTDRVWIVASVSAATSVEVMPVFSSAQCEGWPENKRLLPLNTRVRRLTLITEPKWKLA